MNDTPAVVLVGNIFDGYDVVGPFASFDEAAAWCDKNTHRDTWVATLNSPMKS